MTEIDSPRDPRVEHDQALRELTAASGLSEDEIVLKSVRTLYRAWIGNDPHQVGIPYKKEFSEKDADVVLRQLDHKTFVQAEGFRFKGRVYEAGFETDLASVPSNLTWLVARYGRHSLPAMVHDRRIESDTPPDERENADDEFRDSMNAMQVPFLRRWFMWAAVTFGTLLKRAWPWKLAAVLWVAGYAVLAGLIAWLVLSDLVSWQLQGRTLVAVAVALVIPVLLSAIWGRRYNFGLITAYSVLVLTVPTLAVLVATAIYLLGEAASKPILRALGRPVHPISLKNVREPQAVPGAES
jgi:hypothetical protein